MSTGTREASFSILKACLLVERRVNSVVGRKLNDSNHPLVQCDFQNDLDSLRMEIKRSDFLRKMTNLFFEVG
jgi:hypothetical protein